MAVKIKGDKELLAKIKRLENKQVWKPVLEAAAKDIEGYIKVYPAINSEAEARAAGRRSWWMRGTGPAYRRKDGSLWTGKGSQNLGQQWSVKSYTYKAVIANPVKYAPFVHAADKQPAFHRRRGWRTDAQTIREKGPETVQSLKELVDKLLR